MTLPTATASTRRVPTQSQLSNICGKNEKKKSLKTLPTKKKKKKNELGVFKNQVSLKCGSGYPAGG